VREAASLALFSTWMMASAATANTQAAYLCKLGSSFGERVGGACAQGAAFLQSMAHAVAMAAQVAGGLARSGASNEERVRLMAQACECRSVALETEKWFTRLLRAVEDASPDDSARVMAEQLAYAAGICRLVTAAVDGVEQDLQAPPTSDRQIIYVV
jgi:hypothetical protein